MIFQLAQHSGIIISLFVLYSVFLHKRCSAFPMCKIAGGFLLGGIAITAMKMAVTHSSGISVDGRFVVLSLAGLFGGGIAAGIAVVVAGAYCVFLGGVNVLAGIVTIVSAALAGSGFRLMSHGRPQSLNVCSFYILGIVVYSITLLCQLVIRDGIVINREEWLSVMLVFPVATFLTGLLMCSEDQRLSAEKGLRQSEENFRRSIEESPFGMHIVSEKGETLYANPAFLGLYGFKTIEEFKETSSRKRYSPESFGEHQERKEKRKKGEYVDPEYDIEIVRMDGEKRHIHVYRKVINWNGTAQFHVICQDITERKRMILDLEAAKERAEESDRLKSSFLANISHEVRTPLNVILGFTEMLTHQREIRPETAEEYSGIIKRSADGLLQIIGNLVDISKLETGQLSLYKRSVHIQQMLEGLYSRFHTRLGDHDKRQLKLFLKVPEDPLFLRVDQERLEQIFSNLLDNSIKFTNRGQVGFGVADIREDWIDFFVSDTGIGIEESMRRTVFERFRQASESTTRAYYGTGVGLSIVNRLVVLMGGEISLDSEVGKGTTIQFRLRKG
ncbi:MAG: ATP-binding protein [Prolixibacteraceae bacterium]